MPSAEEITIGLANRAEAGAIAAIHKKEIGQGFLSTLPLSFLGNLYRAIMGSPHSFCVVARRGGMVVGFISGTTSVRGLYQYFLGHYFISSAFMAARKAFSPGFLKRSVENLAYPSKEKDLPEAELLTMAVTSAFQGKGIAGRMFAAFKDEMARRGAKKFRVLVGENLAPAIAFYEKQGFTLVKETRLHGTEVSRIYIHTL